MEEYNPSAEGNEPDNRAEELKRFKMTPGIEEARAAINERFELYGALSLLNQAIESLEPFGRIAQQQLDEMEGRRDRVIARLKELEKVIKEEAERTFRMGGAALLGVRTGARECAATLMVDDMFAGGTFRGSTRYNEATGYLRAIKKEFGRQLLDDEESSE